MKFSQLKSLDVDDAPPWFAQLQWVVSQKNSNTLVLNVWLAREIPVSEDKLSLLSPEHTLDDKNKNTLIRSLSRKLIVLVV